MGDQRFGPGPYPADPGYDALGVDANPRLSTDWQTSRVKAIEQRDEARRAWAKANADCCELKAEVEQMRGAVDAYRAERLEAREGRTFRLVVGERDEAERRIAAALEFGKKWGEGHAGWAAILRGEDG